METKGMVLPMEHAAVMEFKVEIIRVCPQKAAQLRMPGYF